MPDLPHPAMVCRSAHANHAVFLLMLMRNHAKNTVGEVV